MSELIIPLFYQPQTATLDRKSLSGLINNEVNQRSQKQTTDIQRIETIRRIVEDFSLTDFVFAYINFVKSTPFTDYPEKAKDFLKQWREKWDEVENKAGGWEKTIQTTYVLVPLMEQITALISCSAYLPQAEGKTLTQFCFHSPEEIVFGQTGPSHFSLLEAMTVLPEPTLKSLLAEDAENGKKAKENIVNLETTSAQQLQEAKISDPYSLFSPIAAIVSGLTAREVLEKSEGRDENKRKKWQALVSDFLTKVKYETASQWDDLEAFNHLIAPTLNYGNLNTKLPIPSLYATNLTLLAASLSRAGNDFSPYIYDVDEIKRGGRHASLWLRVAEQNLSRLAKEAEEEIPKDWQSLSDLAKNLREKQQKREKKSADQLEKRFLLALLEHVSPYADYRQKRIHFPHPSLSQEEVNLERFLNADTRRNLFNIWLKSFALGQEQPLFFLEQFLDNLREGRRPSETSTTVTEKLLSWLYGTAKDQGDTEFLAEFDRFCQKLEAERLLRDARNGVSRFQENLKRYLEGDKKEIVWLLNRFSRITPDRLSEKAKEELTIVAPQVKQFIEVLAGQLERDELTSNDLMGESLSKLTYRRPDTQEMLNDIGGRVHTISQGLENFGHWWEIFPKEALPDKETVYPQIKEGFRLDLRDGLEKLSLEILASSSDFYFTPIGIRDFDERLRTKTRENLRNFLTELFSLYQPIAKTPEAILGEFQDFAARCLRRRVERLTGIINNQVRECQENPSRSYGFYQLKNNVERMLVFAQLFQPPIEIEQAAGKIAFQGEDFVSDDILKQVEANLVTLTQSQIAPVDRETIDGLISLLSF
jgi:hypothetical protein